MKVLKLNQPVIPLHVVSSLTHLRVLKVHTHPFIQMWLQNLTNHSPSLLQCAWAAVKVIQDFLLKDDPVFFLQFINPVEEFNQSFSS